MVTIFYALFAVLSTKLSERENPLFINIETVDKIEELSADNKEVYDSSGKGRVSIQWIPLIYEGDPAPPLPAPPLEVSFIPS